jgi:iron complex transport system permease protein
MKDRVFLWAPPLALLLSLLVGAWLGPGGPGFPASAEIALIRLPRVLMGAVLGMGLAVSGAALQAVLGNPLAEPYLLGVSGGAACGTALALVLGLPAGLGGTLAMQAISFCFGLAAIMAVYRLARVHGRLPAETMVLSGVVVNAFFSGLLMLLMSVAGRQLQDMVYILMGNLGIIFTRDTAVLLLVTLAVVAGGGFYLWGCSRPLNLLTMGEAQAASMGVPVETLKKRIFLVVAIITAAMVSLAGVIGFVGLMVPHLGRMISGPDNRKLIPVSAFLGGSLLVLADALARNVGPFEIPVGVLTTLLGVPFFAYLLRRKKSGGL